MSQQLRPAGAPDALGLAEQVRELQLQFNELLNSLTQPVYAEPSKRFEGMFAFADGTTWNPGAGRGLYQYISGSWVKL